MGQMRKINAALDDFYRHLATIIGEQRRAIIFVGSTRKLCGFSYTVGNQEKNLPELLLLGRMKADVAAITLNALSELMIINRRAFLEGERPDLGSAHAPLIYSTCGGVKHDYTVQAGQFYRCESYNVQQVMMPDEQGRLPGDPLCHKDFRVANLRITRDSPDGNRDQHIGG